MKINHRRKAPQHPKAPGAWKYGIGRSSFRSKDALDGTDIHAYSIGYDFTCGQHGYAKARHGAKKFVNSRRRRRDRDTLNQEVYTLTDFQ